MKETTILVLLLLSTLVSADMNVDISIITDGEVNMEESVTAEKITSTHNFNANDVEVYFNGISLEDYTPEKEVRIETNTRAALGAFSRSLKIMAEFRTGERDDIDYLEARMLKNFLKLTQHEIENFHEEVTVKEIEALREWLQMNTNQIIVNMDEITKNRGAIQRNANGLNSLGYQVEAQDLALKMMDKDRYCNALVSVMKDNGFKRVKCDVNSRLCYNGDEFKFEGGRDYCLHIDEYEMKPGCYKYSTCGSVGEIQVMTTGGNNILLEVDFTNPHELESRDVSGRLEIISSDGSIVKICHMDLGTVKPGHTQKVTGDCDANLPKGLYDVRVSIAAAGKEVLEDAKIRVDSLMTDVEDEVVDDVEDEVVENTQETTLQTGDTQTSEIPKVIGFAAMTSSILGGFSGILPILLLTILSSFVGGFVSYKLMKK